MLQHDHKHSLAFTCNLAHCVGINPENHIIGMIFGPCATQEAIDVHVDATLLP